MWSGETKEDETRKRKPIQGCMRELVTTVGKWNQSSRERFWGTVWKGREEFYPSASISTGQSFFWGVLTPLHLQFCACVCEHGWAGSHRQWKERSPGLKASIAEKSGCQDTAGHKCCHSNSWSSKVAWVHMRKGSKAVWHKGNVIRARISHYSIRLMPIAEYI